jgi:hypothetical protein
MDEMLVQSHPVCMTARHTAASLAPRHPSQRRPGHSCTSSRKISPAIAIIFARRIMRPLHLRYFSIESDSLRMCRMNFGRCGCLSLLRTKSKNRAFQGCLDRFSPCERLLHSSKGQPVIRAGGRLYIVLVEVTKWYVGFMRLGCLRQCRPSPR